MAGVGVPLIGSVPMTPPIFNPSTPYTVTQSPEVPVSPASPGSVFHWGATLRTEANRLHP